MPGVNLGGDILVAVSLFFSKEIAESVSELSQQYIVIASTILIFVVFSTIETYAEKYYNQDQTVWRKVLKEWSGVGTRTIGFVSLQCTIAAIQKAMNNDSEVNMYHTVLSPLICVLIGISLIRYISAISVETLL